MERRSSFAVFIGLLDTAARSWAANNTSRLGAALAFYSLLSLAPLLVLMLAGASALWGATAAQGRIVGEMQGLVGMRGAAAVQAILISSTQAKGAGLAATLGGFLMLLYGASRALGEFRVAMNLIWQASPPVDKGFRLMLRQRLGALALVAGTWLLLFAALLFSAGLAAFSSALGGASGAGAAALLGAANFCLSYLVAVFLFTLIDKMAPSVRVPWRAAAQGGLLTATLFMFGKGLIGFYLGRFGMELSYGAAGSLVALLLWIYYSSQILFFGAEFAHACQARAAATGRNG